MFSPWYSFSAHPLARVVDEMSRLFDDLDARCDPARAGHQHSAAINVSADDDGVTVTALMPGLRKEDIEVTAEGEVLTLAGRSRHDDGSETRLARRLRLPGAVDGNAIQARYEHGVLTVVLPRPAASKPRRIDVAVN
jgi:HSP20 family protein